jgi:hexosaminidase
MIYGRNPADLNWNSPHAPPIGPPSLGGPHFIGAEGCIWGESVWPETLHSLTWPRASVLAERLWLPDRFFGHANATNGKGLHPPEWQGELTTVYEARLIQWMCQLLRRGLAASPVDDRDKFPRRSLWQQCNIDLPPPPAKQRPPTPPV